MHSPGADQADQKSVRSFPKLKHGLFKRSAGIFNNQYKYFRKNQFNIFSDVRSLIEEVAQNYSVRLLNLRFPSGNFDSIQAFDQ
jgi:hypothetical protein